MQEVCPVFEFGTINKTLHKVNECVSVEDLQTTESKEENENGYNKIHHLPYTKSWNAKEIMSYAPQKNPYWNHVIQSINNNESRIKQLILNELSFTGSPIPVDLITDSGAKQLTTEEGEITSICIKLDISHTRNPYLRYIIVRNSEQYNMDICFKNNFFDEPVGRISLIS